MAHETTDSPRHRHDASPAAVIAVGGLDSSGAAGLVRDFLTASALGASAHLVATAWTLQIPGGVQAVESRPASSVQADLVGAISGVRPGAVKVGMVASGAIAEAIVSGLAGFGGAVVYDPVIRASSGGQLFAGNERALRSLLTRATLVTPNLAEAAALSGRPVASAEDARAAGEVLLGAGARAVLIKG
ncbi:MAG TPA: PfkB family carbohydrate kinase, partial [Polyangia bacterium]